MTCRWRREAVPALSPEALQYLDDVDGEEKRSQHWALRHSSI